MPLKRMKEDAPGKHKKRVHKRPLNIRKILLSCLPAGRIPGNYWWGCLAWFSKSWPYLRPKNVNFQPVFRPGHQENVPCKYHKNFLKSTWFISNSNISLSFYLIWNWNDEYVHTIPWFARLLYPIPDQNDQRLYPFSDQNGAKPYPLGRHIHTWLI